MFLSLMRALCAGLIFSLLALPPEAAFAEGCSPVQLSLWPSVQLVSREKTICGARLDLLWGKNDAVWGLDLGLANGGGEVRGIEAGVVMNRLRGRPEDADKGSWGIQLGGVVNTNEQEPFTGIQAAGLLNDHDDAPFSGLQFAGLLNDNDRASFTGVQLALFSNQNFESEVTGLQVAAFNHAKTFNGVQIGLGNGVSAVEGAVALVVVPICFLAAIGGGSGPCPLYEEKKAHLDQAVTGAQIGVFTNVTKQLTGLQISPFFNGAGTSMNGFQSAVIGNVAGEVEGLQLAAAINAAEGNVNGFQIGGFNFAGKDFTGAQIGIVNICGTLKGVQFGAINIVTSRFPNSLFVFPIVNAGF
jgi:hypothetical protein